MKRFSAQYIITGTGDLLKRGIITTDNDGVITDITDTGGQLPELQNTLFYNGVIVPGFINSHCHLELSAMKGMIGEGAGLARFIREVNTRRDLPDNIIARSIEDADQIMYRSGVSACADICNGSSTFKVKEKSRIDYINLLEVFGVNPALASKRVESAISLRETASQYSLESFIVPHSLYSVSKTLISSLKEITKENRVTSIHFMESQGEREYLVSGGGEMRESYLAMGISEEMISDRLKSHSESIINDVTSFGNLILVHNTFAGEEEIESVLKRGNTYWCLCLASNIYIEKVIPDVEMLRKMGAEIVIGTDSLASNHKLSMLDEIKIISLNYPDISLTELIEWATINGARALTLDSKLGSIEKGKQPGLVLLENLSLADLTLTESTTSRRLI